jgi:hypothetical protein
LNKRSSWFNKVLKRDEKGETDSTRLQQKDEKGKEKGKQKVEPDMVAQRSALYGALAGR